MFGAQHEPCSHDNNDIPMQNAMNISVSIGHKVNCKVGRKNIGRLLSASVSHRSGIYLWLPQYRKKTLKLNSQQHIKRKKESNSAFDNRNLSI